MKNNLKTVCMCLLMLSINLKGFSQSLNDFFNKSETKMTWLGIDFSESRLFGDAMAENFAMKDKYFPGINELVMAEPKKYDVAKAFSKVNVTFDMNVTKALNDKMDIDKFKSMSSEDMHRFTPEMIDAMVKKYDFGKNTGIGVVFIMEGMDKMAKSASMYVTIVDMGAKKVLMTKRMTGEAKGFGFRNYWAFSISEVLKQIEKSEYRDWKSKAK